MLYLQPTHKRLLNSLNPIIFVLVVYLFILLRSTGRPLAPVITQQWDVLLPFMIYFGQRRSVAEGLILSLFTGHLYSLSSSAPIGVFVTHYLMVFLVARLLSYVIYADTWFSVLLIMFSLAVLSRITLAAVSSLFGHGWPVLSSSNFVWWGIFLNTVGGLFVYRFLAWVDRMTHKTADVAIELGDSEG